MDRERQKELLTAYLDRELSPDERAAVERSLENSAEARMCLHELELTSRFLRRLPARPLEADFADGVLDRLQRESLLRPEPEAPKRSNRRMIWWMSGPLAAAAVLLLAVWLNREPHPDPGVAPSFITSLPIPPATRDQSMAATTSEQLADKDILPGDYLACGVTVVDVRRGIEEFKALAAQYDISFDSSSDEPTLTTENPSAPGFALIEYTTTREKAEKLLGQMGQMIVVAGVHNSNQSSSFVGVTFNKEEILLATEADDQKGLTQAPAGTTGLISHAGESSLRESESAAKASVDKTETPAATAEVSRAAGADKVGTSGESQQLNTQALQSRPPEKGQVYFGQDSPLAIEKLRTLVQEERLFARKQETDRPKPGELVKVLMQFRQVPNQDDLAKKRRN